MKYLILCAGALLAATTAAAAPIAVTSYDMPNGDGQASGGSFNYWDASYTGTGATTTDGAALAGGTGDLTDGYAEPSVWYQVENGAGTGPYVGWYAAHTLNPVVTFHFAGSPNITSIAVALDNSTVGGVYAPNILIDGVLTPYLAPAAGTAGIVTFTGLNLTGTTHTLEFAQNFGGWSFVSEVSFAGATVPEPASWALMVGGFGVVGFAARRRRATVAA